MLVCVDKMHTIVNVTKTNLKRFYRRHTTLHTFIKRAFICKNGKVVMNATADRLGMLVYVERHYALGKTAAVIAAFKNT